MSDYHDHRLETRLVHAGLSPGENHGVVNPPVYHASTIVKPTLADWEASNRPGYTGYSYGRSGTPTTRAFEAAMEGLYACEHGVTVSSGLAAIALALIGLTRAGDHILVADSIYYPSRRICETVLKRYGVATSYYDPAIGAGIAALIQPNTTVICAEAPGSITFEMQDIPAICAAAHAHGAKVIMDNTWATALFFNPFTHGVDVVVEAITKFVGGHSDLMMGMVLADGALGASLRALANNLGYCSGPDDIYLAQRGLRTLGVRLARHQASGLTIAHYLQTRAEVTRLLHPALPDDPGHALWQRDFRGAPGLFSFILKPVPRAALAALLEGLEFFGMGASWGGYESLIATWDPRGVRSATTWTEPGQLVRVHIGLEDPADLIADLDAGFKRMAAAS